MHGKHELCQLLHIPAPAYMPCYAMGVSEALCASIWCSVARVLSTQLPCNKWVQLLSSRYLRLPRRYRPCAAAYMRLSSVNVINIISKCDSIPAGATGALLSYGTTQLLADRTMASAIGNASRRALAAGMVHAAMLCHKCQLMLARSAASAAQTPLLLC